MKDNIKILYKAACEPYNNGTPKLIQIKNVLGCEFHSISNILTDSRNTLILGGNINILYEAACTPYNNDPPQLIQIKNALRCEFQSISSILGRSRDELEYNIKILYEAACNPYHNGISKLVIIQNVLGCELQTISHMLEGSRAELKDNIDKLYDDIENVTISAALRDSASDAIERLSGNSTISILFPQYITPELIKHIRSKIIVRTPEDLGVKDELVMIPHTTGHFLGIAA